METLTIGQLAGRFGLPTHVLRHWESVGVLEPASRVSGRRRYLPGQESRIAMILRAKTAGLSLEQIREILDAPDLRARRELLRTHHADLERRRREIEAAQQMVEHALRCPAPDFTLCLSFQELVHRIDAGAAQAGGAPTAAGATGEPLRGSDAGARQESAADGHTAGAPRRKGRRRPHTRRP